MPQVTCFGRTVEVTEDYFLFLVQGAVAGAHSLAQGLLAGYNEGSVDDTERKGSPAPETLAQLWMLIEQIEDPELRGLMEGFHGQVRQIVDFDDDLLVPLAAFVNLPRLRTGGTGGGSGEDCASTIGWGPAGCVRPRSRGCWRSRQASTGP